MHGLNLYLSANSSLVILLFIFIFLSGYCAGGDLRVTWASLCWRLFHVLHYLFFQPYTHLEHRMTIHQIACWFHSGTPTYRQKTSREYQKHTDSWNKIYKVWSLIVAAGVLFTLAAGLTVTGSFSSEHFSSPSRNFCLAFLNSLMNILNCLLPAVLL